MSLERLTVSSKFPEGYGDFAIKSGDGVICYFPKQLLSLTSTVFNDMFAISEASQGESSVVDGASRQVDVVENVAIVELFLTLIDPRLSNPPIDRDTIHDLLQMADKYQTNSILQWFEQEALIERVNYATQSKSESLLLAYPKFLLSLAIRFGLMETAKIALNELAGCDYKYLIAKPDSISLALFIEICKIRDERIRRLQGEIDLLAKRRGFYSEYDSELSDSGIEVCIQCAANRAQWISNMERAVQRSPKWATFIQAYKSNVGCDRCEILWSEHFSRTMKILGWERMKDEEPSLSDWSI
jgi:BTB/POZ domain